MTRPCSNDPRERTVSAVAADDSRRTVAARSGVAVSSAVKRPQRDRRSGSVAAGKAGGHTAVAAARLVTVRPAGVAN